MKKLFYFIFLFLMVCLSVQSQEIEITGIVLDENNEPSPFAIITIEAKSTSSLADYTGYFKINGAKGDVLSIRALGYDTQEIIIANQEFPLMITLSPPRGFGITYSKAIDDRIDNLYFAKAFKATSVLGYKFSFSNKKRKAKRKNSKSGVSVKGLIYHYLNIGVEAVTFRRKIELINPYLQFDFQVPKLGFGNGKIELDVEPFINTGYAYSFSHKAFKPKFDFGSKILEIKLPREFTLELFGNYSIMHGRDNAFFLGINLGNGTTIARVYY